MITSLSDLSNVPTELLIEALADRHIFETTLENDFIRVTEHSADIWQVPIDIFTAKERGPNRLANIRQAAMSTLYDLGHSSLAVGPLFGNRDHSTVRHALKTTSTLAATNADIAARLNQLRTRLNLEPHPETRSFASL